ncbi:UDP-N-acetylglucosamine 1-carboxyvinyltransferase [Candidatus Electrothrix marina]|uniref:UDP-N-acetylglucosamine 1-carboxyvinyltransferase n=1 Tax=Candidatus Electrothrix marina TaxID=1859130 RepID=A0A444JGS4_9BACT|nr:UDP-N-acetylglucosamine 1-carboxyvinyltransferase [Candidatus Electrothrix marina]
MDKIRINGGRPLRGSIKVSGAKNAALPLLAATLLTPGTYTLHNVPDLRDTRTMLMLLQTLGATWERSGGSVQINTTDLTGAEAPYDLVKTMRASVLVLGPLLTRTGHARVSLPGGCAIGARPINFHLRGFEQLGAVTHLESGYVEARVQGSLTGNTMYFDIPSVTGTENVLMASVKATGTTIIRNAAKEPEVGNLIDMLTAMGARIEGRDTDCLTVIGVASLQATEATIIPDRIEAGTYAIAVGATGGELEITDCDPSHLPVLIEKLQAVGMTIEAKKSSIIASCPLNDQGHSCPLQAVNITTMPYPGFPTDLQAQFMALMIQCNGTSIIHETIFENRFMHVAELQRLGAKINIDGATAVINGIARNKLIGAPMMATDLRASASLVVAGLSASGITEISRIYHLERGYENMVEKLRRVGAEIEQIAG